MRGENVQAKAGHYLSGIQERGAEVRLLRLGAVARRVLDLTNEAALPLGN